MSVNESKKANKYRLYNPLWWALYILIRLYRVISTRLPSKCRFYPSCSQYALDALNLHGFTKSVFKIVIRISKCHPFHPGGIDKAK